MNRLDSLRDSLRDNLRDGVRQAWETVADGWQELVGRAGDALTRFHPRRPSGAVESREEQHAWRGSRWGILAAEVSVDDEEVEVALEVPGMEPDDFEIQVLDDTLIVRGHKRVERQRQQGEFHIMERAYGSFERAIRLPSPVDESKTKAQYRRGVLRVTLPRTESHKARRITVVSS